MSELLSLNSAERKEKKNPMNLEKVPPAKAIGIRME